MRNSRRTTKNTFRFLSVSVAAFVAHAGAASAGGFDIHEQSTVLMGTASAGAAAGGTIGSMYWNPAAAASLPGTNTESSYTLILPYANAHVDSIAGIPANGLPGRDSGDVAIDAATSASYGTYQVSKDLWIGMGINSPFGLATKPEDPSYLGSVLGVTTKLITIDANPTVAYRIAPGITIGGGLQVMWAQGKLQFDALPGVGNSQFLGTDWAVGGTAGIMVEPMQGTTIGLGYRSGIDLSLEGGYRLPAIVGGAAFPAVGKLKLPDLVTLSIRQEITPRARLLGTVEWTNWSRFQSLDLISDGVGGKLAVPANWSDGWFFSVGGEYDYTPAITLRTGVAYEMSPEDTATKRFTTIPDNNRVWLNLGASYKWSESVSLDVSYAHIFVQDGAFDRTSPLGIPVTGTIDASCDLVSVGMRTVW